jgi:hypothetical protein
LVIINNIVDSTYTNAQGYKLYVVLLPFFIKNEKVDLSFVDLTPMSTSFLNSSLGALIEEFGFEQFKHVIRPVEITKSHAEVLSMYLKSLLFEAKFNSI